MSATITPRQIEQILAGDARLAVELDQIPHRQLEGAWGDSNKPRLAVVAVIRVLDDLLNEKITSSTAQRWAAFIRRGYAEREGGAPVRPLEIEYAHDCEDEMIEAIDALDQLGDVIDGNPDPAGIGKLAEALRRCNSAGMETRTAPL